MFCPLLSSSEHSGVPEDSKSQLFQVLGFTPTLGQSRVATKRLKRNKSIALDGIKAEFLLNVGDMLHVPMQIVFNKLLQQGYSLGLFTRVIHALHKGGDAL